MTSIIYNSVIPCDKIIEPTKTVSTKTVLTKSTLTKSTSMKTVLTKSTLTSFHNLLTFLLITMALLIAVSIYCYLIKHLWK